MALTSAVTIVATTPALLSSPGLAVPGIAQPLAIRTENVELAALADITVQGIVDAYWSGWGGYIGASDPYYPNINPTGNTPVYVKGASGVAYYLTDEVLNQFGAVNLDNYFFEVGAYYGTGSATAGSGAGALIYVGSSELFGASSPIAQLAKAVFYYGVPQLTQATIVQLATLLPTVKIGPVKVGGGILASLYFTGQTPDGTYSYGSAGLSAVLGYITTSISDALPKVTGATVQGAAATKQDTVPVKETAAQAQSGSGSAAGDKAGDSTSTTAVAKSVSTPAAAGPAVGHTKPTSTSGSGDTTTTATETGTSAPADATATKSGAQASAGGEQPGAGVKAAGKSGEKTVSAAGFGGKSGGGLGGSHTKG